MNSKPDWYRRTTWTTADQAEYFAKLKRARDSSRPRYLVIQASNLAGTADPTLLDGAETLIKILFADYPDDKFNRSAGLEVLGDIYRLRQVYDTAMVYYKKSIDFEHEYPNVRSNAFLQFSELAVKLNKREFYPFVEALLSERLEHYPFPIYKYKIYSLLSVINKANGHNAKASELAELAEKFAALQTSGFRYHPTVGVVTERDADLDRLMKKE
jgi:tetratricopeptide (TPR) repeat protein